MFLPTFFHTANQELWFFRIRGCGGVEQEVPAWLMLQWADTALPGMFTGDCPLWGGEGQRVFTIEYLEGTGPLSSTFTAPWSIPTNWAVHLSPLLGETISLLQEASLESPKVTPLQGQSHMAYIKSTGIVQGSFVLTASLWDHCLITCLLSFALPLTEMGSEFSGMINSLLKCPLPLLLQLFDPGEDRDSF